jgi:hypothetical protein
MYNASRLLRLPPEHRSTYMLAQPTETHFRVVSCKTAAEYGECKHYAEGFILPLAADKVDDTCAFLTQYGYTFNLCDTPEGYPAGTRTFNFPAGQRCLPSRANPHRISLNRPPVLAVVGGDWRGNPRGEMTRYNNIEDWADKLRTDTDTLRTEQEKG